MGENNQLLAIHDLTVEYKTDEEVVYAVNGINLEIISEEGAIHQETLQSGTYYVDWTMLSALNYAENIRLVDGRVTHADVSGGIGNQDESFNAIADKCYGAFDETERMAAYKEAQQYMRDNYCVVGVCTTVRCEVMTPGLTPPMVNGGVGSEVDYTTIRPA